MSRKAIFIGKDPNLKGMRCKILSQHKGISEVLFDDEIIGKFIRRIPNEYLDKRKESI